MEISCLPSSHPSQETLSATVARIQDLTELADTLNALGFQKNIPALVLVGGASGISEPDMHYLQHLFIDVLAPLIQTLGVVVIDGGTDAGIMQLIGQARTKIGATFPLIGVAAIDTVILPDRSPASPNAAPLEPNHTHFLLVPGSQWGDESPWIANVATTLSENCPSLTIAINGGNITWLDLHYSVAADRPIITLAGSGRTADKLAAALQGQKTDERATEILAAGHVQAIDLKREITQLTQTIKEMLST